MSHQRGFWAIVLLILLLAGGLRLYGATYGDQQICLTPPAEYWLYDQPQVTSLYATQLRTSGVATLEDQLIVYPRIRTTVITPDEWLLARLGGAIFGLLTVALVLRLGRHLGSNWWQLAGLLVAVTPWFVETDRWLVRFDPAPSVVALSLLTLAFSYAAPQKRRYRWPQLLAALSLLLVAPPLWWLTIALVLLQPQPKWRFLVFVVIGSIIVFPALQSLFHWFSAAGQWNSGTTAACLLVGLTLALWRFPRLTWPYRGALIVVILIVGSLTVINTIRLPNPTPSEWELIHWLQQRLPDNTRVSFDSATWNAATITACPMGNHIVFTPLRYNSRDQLPPDYIVTTNRDNLTTSSFIHDLGNGYYVGRQLQLPHPVDIRFGDLLTVLSYEVLTPQVIAGETIHLRLDYQLTEVVTADALRYAAFIHVVPPGQLGDKVVDFNFPLVQELSAFGPRLVLTNQHYRFALPAKTAPGVYDILFGIYDVYSGARLLTSNGDVLTIGQLEVRPQ